MTTEQKVARRKLSLLELAQELGVPPDAAAILAGLIGAADNDVLDFFGSEPALPDDFGNDRSQHGGREGCAVRCRCTALLFDRTLTHL